MVSSPPRLLGESEQVSSSQQQHRRVCTPPIMATQAQPALAAGAEDGGRRGLGLKREAPSVWEMQAALSFTCEHQAGGAAPAQAAGSASGDYSSAQMVAAAADAGLTIALTRDPPCAVYEGEGAAAGGGLLYAASSSSSGLASGTGSGLPTPRGAPKEGWQREWQVDGALGAPPAAAPLADGALLQRARHCHCAS